MTEKETLLKLLKQELTKDSIPQNYRAILSKSLEVLSQQEKELSTDRKKMDALETKCTQYSNYVKAAEDNYGSLTELYKAEHSKNLDQQEQIITLKTKLKDLEEIKATKEQLFQQQFEQMKIAHNEKFEKQKDDYTKSANKQAMGRRNIEEKLMYKDIELSDLKKRLQDLETRLTHSEAQKQEKAKEADFFKNENTQLKLLVAYLQPQQIHQAHQTQQAQNQQHIQPSPQPPHNPRY